MPKQQILLISVLSVILITFFSLGLVLVLPKLKNREIYQMPLLTTKNYNLNTIKTFPAPYARVNGLPLDRLI